MDIEKYRQEIQEVELNNSNKRDILKLDMRNANKNLKPSSRIAYLRIWQTFAQFLGNKPFRKASREDIDKFFYNLGKGDILPEAKKPSVATTNLYKISIKKLYGMLYPNSKTCPKIVAHLAVNKNDEGGIRKLQKEDLLTPKDVERMVHAAQGARNKAIVKVLFESAFRLSEFLSMKVESVVFNKDEAVVKINSSKTKLRTVLIIDSLPELRAWVQEHPLNDSSEAPLWISNRMEAMSGRNVQNIVKQAARCAKINKHVFVHLFRHSRITWLRRMGMVREESCMFAGWSPKSKMVEYYSHFDISDMFNRQRKTSGLPVDEPEEDRPVKRFEVCPVCEKTFPVGHALCDYCNMPLDAEKRIEMLKEAQERGNAARELKRLEPILEQMKQIEPVAMRMLPLLEKLGNNGGLLKLEELLEKVGGN